ncbi:MAG: DUF2313 domain-containing protein [Pseudomonas sp.]|nr:DUF2313 domain-containing protein [Pseudomonas sp.]
MAVTAADYGRQLGQLLPPGTAWTSDPDSNLQRLLLAMGASMARVHQRADDLDRETDPAQAQEILERWEAVLGLPDKCSGLLETTLQGRRNAVLAKLFSTGGQSVAFFLGVARALGFDTSITEFRPFRAGRSCAGDPIANGDWSSAWRLNAPLTSAIDFRVGISTTGEPLRAWGNDTLECKINQLKPAHTRVIYGYGLVEEDKQFYAADRLFRVAHYVYPEKVQ